MRVPFDKARFHAATKHRRENQRAERQAEKAARRADRKRPGSERFPSAFPEAPEAYEGIARTLSRGLE